uniref:Uncharacterized protein n=1 Tax=Davidia involucrata TaxID=16924 RepID=A0A5B7C4Q8_DAVIN
MGNCLFGGMGDEVNDDDEVIKVATSNGGIMEFYGGAITVESITHEFPGHGIFRSHDLFWKPLAQQQVLLAGESYYLLPLTNTQVQVGHIRSNSVPSQGQQQLVPYRMSFDTTQAQGQGVLLKRSYTQVFSRYNNNNNYDAFWKVKLVISPQHLLEILSQEARTQELIESVRTVAKCGSGAAAFSDHHHYYSSFSSSSSRN